MSNDENKPTPASERSSADEETRRLEILYGPKQPGMEDTTDADILMEEEVIVIEDEIIPPVKPMEESVDPHQDFNGESETTDKDFKSEASKFRDINSLIELVLNPFVLPTIIMLLLLKISILNLWIDNETATKFTLVVAGATFALPILLLFLLKTGGVVKSFTLWGRNERICPYIIEIFALGGIAWFLHTTGFPSWVSLIFVGLTACGLVNFIINFWFKISCQASALAAVVASLMVINNDGLIHPELVWWIIGTVLLLGVAGMGALLARRHTLVELLAGYATGFLSVYLFSLAA